MKCKQDSFTEQQMTPMDYIEVQVSTFEQPAMNRMMKHSIDQNVAFEDI